MARSSQQDPPTGWWLRRPSGRQPL
jgi:hypothetical protein